MPDFTSPQKKAVSVEDVLDRIRERTRLNRSRDSDRIRESLARLTGNILQCQQLQNTVGGVNPRNSGPLNAIIQSTKRVMARALSWYSRPIQQFQTAAIRALSECATALDEMNQNVDALSDFSQSLVVDLDKKISQLLSCADSHQGPRAQRGLWFNDPVIVSYEQTVPKWIRTSERIIEKSWVLRNLGDLEPPASVLDIGCAESLLSFELASTGFRVTGVDLRDYALQHPGFQFLQGDITGVALADDSFDAAILLSTIEHIGLACYGASADLETRSRAMRRINNLLKPAGRLLITVPFGVAAETPLHTIFDSASLRELLEDFVVKKMEFGAKKDERTWVAPVAEDQASALAHNPENYAPSAVAMALCVKR